MAVGKVVGHLRLTSIDKELKISVKQGRVIITLNIINTLNVLFSVLIKLTQYPTRTLRNVSPKVIAMSQAK